ncbi:MAG: shikimate dehydrogenase [Euryarchaeota archaeon]|nr:shikimate dehydrogenase [Euryarchaeota archaeon]
MITGKTKVVGIIGDPVEHSLSPPMHNAAFRYLKMDYVYVPFLVKKDLLQSSIIGAKSLDIKGLNVTIPHKTEVLSYLDYIDRSAELIGAVNTLKFENKIIKGFNTDGIGAIRAIEEETPVKDKKIVILGAGGAARAVSFQMLIAGAGSVVIANRTPENAILLKESLVAKLDGQVKTTDLSDKLEKELKDADILINTTPIGMFPNIHEKPLVKAEMMHSDLVVNDLVYNPIKTGLLKEAEQAGLKPISGIKMLIYQGIESFKIWTGITPPVNVLEDALRAVLPK